MTLQIGTLGFLTWVCYLIIFGFLARSITARFPDSALSKALGYIY